MHSTLKLVVITLLAFILGLSTALVLCYDENFDPHFGKHDQNQDLRAAITCEIALSYVDAVTAKAKPGSVVFSGEGSGKDVTSCDSVRALLKERGIAYGPAAVEQATSVPNHGPFKSVVLSASMPVLSEDGGKAVLQTGWRAAPLGGEGRSTTMRRMGGRKWVIMKQSPTWIS